MGDMEVSMTIVFLTLFAVVGVILPLLLKKKHPREWIIITARNSFMIRAFVVDGSRIQEASFEQAVTLISIINVLYMIKNGFSGKNIKVGNLFEISDSTHTLSDNTKL
jgi:hypothetical protein